MEDKKTAVKNKESNTEKDKYTHVGRGYYKPKGKENDQNSPTFKREGDKYVEIKGEVPGSNKEQPQQEKPATSNNTAAPTTNNEPANNTIAPETNNQQPQIEPEPVGPPKQIIKPQIQSDETIQQDSIKSEKGAMKGRFSSHDSVMTKLSGVDAETGERKNLKVRTPLDDNGKPLDITNQYGRVKTISGIKKHLKDNTGRLMTAIRMAQDPELQAKYGITQDEIDGFVKDMGKMKRYADMLGKGDNVYLAHPEAKEADMFLVSGDKITKLGKENYEKEMASLVESVAYEYSIITEADEDSDTSELQDIFDSPHKPSDTEQVSGEPEETSTIEPDNKSSKITIKVKLGIPKKILPWVATTEVSSEETSEDDISFLQDIFDSPHKPQDDKEES